MGLSSSRNFEKRSPLIAERSIVIGHPRYDKLCIKNNEDSRSLNEKSIGLISRFDLINI